MREQGWNPESQICLQIRFFTKSFLSKETEFQSKFRFLYSINISENLQFLAYFQNIGMGRGEDREV